jgi:hypothetical protein
MYKIIVCDNFLTTDEINTGCRILKNGLWKFGHRSVGEYLYEDKFWKMNLRDNDFFSVYLLKVIEKQFSKKFKLAHVYANGHTFAQDGHFHTDSEETNHFTFCLYFTKIEDQYVESAGGYIYFKFPELKHNICYEPIYNRGILFPSIYTHKGTSFTRYVMDMRICVAWKLILIE